MKIKYLNKDLPESIFFDDEITIGREEDNSLQLMSDGISRHHGRIFYLDGQWYIEDLGSTNGIKLNGSRISAQEILHENDVIDFYQDKLQIYDFAEQENSAPAIIISPSTETAKISITDIIDPSIENTAAVDPLIITPAQPDSISESVSLTPADETENPNSEKKSDLDELTQFIKQNTGNLFNKNNKNQQASAGQSAAAAKKPFSNKLFYVVLICAVIVIGAFLIKIIEDKNKPVRQHNISEKNQDSPLYLNYIKENISANNVFRFTLSIENNQATFTVDDLRSQLRYGPVVKYVSDSELAKLKQVIKDSNFLTTPKVEPGISTQDMEFKELEIYYGNNSNTITLKNRPTPREFMDIEEALTLFSESCNMATISLSPEVLKEQAENSFNIANDKLANYETNLAFLKEAVDGFNITVEYLSGVSPEPEIRKIAAQKLKRAQTLRENWIKQYRSQYTSMINKRDLEGAKNAIQTLLSLYDENSKEYQVFKQRLIKIDILRRRMQPGRK